jgi:hypothetical protein
MAAWSETPQTTRDHDIGVARGWQYKSEIPGAADQANLIIEWTAGL